MRDVWHLKEFDAAGKETDHIVEREAVFLSVGRLFGRIPGEAHTRT